MTKNQIDYLKHLEQARSNKAQEAQKANELSETHRANVARETNADRTLDENVRHNKVSEVEVNRHNQITEHVDVGKLVESQRHNYASEQELARSNRVSEVELERSNRAREEENSRHNKVVEAETQRDNQARVALGYAQLSETRLHNRTSENLNAAIHYDNNAQENANRTSRERMDMLNRAMSFDIANIQAGASSKNAITQLVGNVGGTLIKVFPRLIK